MVFCPQTSGFPDAGFPQKREGGTGFELSQGAKRSRPVQAIDRVAQKAGVGKVKDAGLRDPKAWPIVWGGRGRHSRKRRRH